MKTWKWILSLLLITGFILAAGCSQPAQKSSSTDQGVGKPSPAPAPPGATGKITPAYLTQRVKEAVAYARENGREKAIAAFNDPNGSFVKDGVYIFAEEYSGMALAEPFEHTIVGTNIRDMTDRYGVPLVRHLGETAGYGIGFVSYDYPNPADNREMKPKLSVVA